MKYTLIFDLGGGFNDMIKTLIHIINFTSKNNITFTIRYCTARPQDLSKPIADDSIKLNNYMYDVTNLFDENTFLIYDNYISYNKIQENITPSNTYDFYTDKKIKDNVFNKDKKEYMNEISKNILNIFNDSNKEFIIVGQSFCFYTHCNTIDKWNKQFYTTLIPNQKILDEYNIIKKTIKEPYNFIHYRYENDMKIYVQKITGENKIYILDDLLDANLFKNNNYKTYVATTAIEELHKKLLMKKPIECYNNILYKTTSNLLYFDENAWVDFKIGLESEEIYGFKYSGFSETINRFKGTNNYYNNLT